MSRCRVAHKVVGEGFCFSDNWRGQWVEGYIRVVLGGDEGMGAMMERKGS